MAQLRNSRTSEADEITSLAPDIIEGQILRDDPILSNVISRAITGTREEWDEVRALQADSNLEEQAPPPALIQRRRSTISRTIRNSRQRIEKFGWYDDEFKRERIKVYSIFVRNYLLVSVILIVALGFMWGTYYNRQYRYVDMKMLIVSEDEVSNGIVPIIGPSMNATAHIDGVAQRGGWEYVTRDEFLQHAADRNNTIDEEIFRLVHHQLYWSVLHVKPNATYQIYEAIVNNDTSFMMNGTLVEVFFETGRDIVTVSSYTVAFLNVFEQVFFKVIRTQFHRLVSQLPQDSLPNAAFFFAQPITFNFNDLRPASVILMAPLQIGLVYIVIFAFFLMTMTIPIQIYLASIVKGLRFLLFRFFWTQMANLTISLAYVVLNIVFGVTYKAAFGRSGALVLWAVAYLTIGSLAALNEIVASLCFLHFPALIGGWLLFLVVVNVAPTTSAMVLSNHFYRYGYAMPIHNAYDLCTVIFCNVYKGKMRRNFGILIAWFVSTNALAPFILIYVAKKRARMAAEDAEKAKLAQSTPEHRRAISKTIGHDTSNQSLTADTDADTDLYTTVEATSETTDKDSVIRPAAGDDKLATSTSSDVAPCQTIKGTTK